MNTLIPVAVSSALASVLLTAVVLRYARSSRLLDMPNERSSHHKPTPRGGGLAIVTVSLAVLAALTVTGDLNFQSTVCISVAGGVVAAVGWADDRRSVSALFRLLVHFGAVALVVIGTDHLGPLDMPLIPPFVVLQGFLAVLALVWLLNLFNFMDGIDGIAAAEAVFVALGIGVCNRLLGGGGDGVGSVAVIIAGATAGFLIWNWPPARIFMGDVGSGFLGFMLGALALLAHRLDGLNLWVPSILLGVFVTDATVALVRRMLRRERWYAAHRSHAYQWLARRFGAHLPVTLAVIGLNVIWLLPLAMMATVYPARAPVIAGIAYLPLVIAALWAGSGRHERA